jgi:hypothetical protein
MKNSIMITDAATRKAISDIEDVINKIEAISALAIPSTADETTKRIIHTINKITNSYKRKT